MIVDKRETAIMRLIRRVRELEARFLTRRRLLAIISGTLLAWSIWAIGYPMSVLLKIRSQAEFEDFLLSLVTNDLIRGNPGLTWFQVRIGLEGGIGLIVFTAGLMLLFGMDRTGIPIAMSAMLISLTIINLLIFYFDQFSTIFSALVQLIALLLMMRYRNRYLINPLLPT